MEKNNNFVGFFILLFVVSFIINIYFFTKSDKNTYINNVTKDNNEILNTGTNDNFYIPKEIGEVLGYENIYKINIFEKSYIEFKNINNFDNYKKWRDLYSQKFLLLSFIKLKDYESWDKYYDFLYDYYIEVEGGDFGKDFKNDTSFQKHADPKENFKLYMKEFYEKIISGEQIIATKENIDNDLNLSFASNDFSDLKNLCEYREKNIDKSMEAMSCMDDNYFYRATKENKYCEKIIDPYKVRLCNDFLDYQNK